MGDAGMSLQVTVKIDKQPLKSVIKFHYLTTVKEAAKLIQKQFSLPITEIGLHSKHFIHIRYSKKITNEKNLKRIISIAYTVYT